MSILQKIGTKANCNKTIQPEFVHPTGAIEKFSKT